MVYSGKLRGKRVAIKTILVENINDENIASFKKEVDIMTKLRYIASLLPFLALLLSLFLTPYFFLFL